MQYWNFSKCKILVGKILMIEHTFVKFVRLFHHQSFTLYGNMLAYSHPYGSHYVQLSGGGFGTSDYCHGNM